MHFLLSRLFHRLVKLNNRFLIWSSIAMIGSCSFLIYWLEPDTYGNPFNGLWWVMSTITTVGYGDFYPHTVAGKLVGMLIFMFGIGLGSILISKLVDTFFVFKRNKEAGNLKYTGSNHFVIIEWSTHAASAIQEILHTDAAAEIVLIDERAQTPILHDNVHYVRGNPVLPETLQNANLAEAKAVFIFSKEMTEDGMFLHDSSFIDGKTLLIATAIERNYAEIYTIVEIKERENIHSFTHIKVNEFILGDETISRLAVRSAFNPGAAAIISQLLTSRDGEDLYEIAHRIHWHHYRDAFEELLNEGATLISNGKELNINRRLDEEIPKGARLFVICDHATYLRISPIAQVTK
ncbi:potassium channel protein [Paenibacillus agricola]|uniref:Potassium channel protein n=1 Tax=Paenibacillus agricola TaxID=2716264 RepID=A0ABX0J2T9_9BACL|nr:potassium channel family protein [Paenibacillus agricola]NHN29187.1 potassium channel protein [Paenibacillus agricola]